MDVKALQARLRTFAAERDWPPFHSPKNLAMALMVEAAELLALFQWLTTAQSYTFTQNPQDKERVGDEMADVLLYLLQLADHTGVDLAEAAERKMRKNAIKHPSKNPPPAPVVQPKPSPKVHLLVDWENVQPKGADLKTLVPEGTDVWLFHGPGQKVDSTRFAAEYEASRVTLVPSARAGKNALDFHLTYYIGYISARQQDATFVVVSNDTGYDPMLEHSRLLGFSARRQDFQRAVVEPVQAVAVSVVPAIAYKKSAGLAVATPAAKAKTQAPVKALAHDVVPVASAPANSSAASEKATRQDVQALVRFVQQMKPPDRPAHREVLLALIKAQLGERSAYSPRVAHALAQLRAQQCLTLKGDEVGYLPLPGVVQAAPKVVPVKKEAAKKPPVSAVGVSPGKLIRQKQTQQAVQFLKQMAAGERPVRRNALLALLAAQSGVTSMHSPTVVHTMAHLLAQGWVAVLGETVSYPQWSPPTKPVASKATVKTKGAVKPAAAAAPPKKPLTPAQMVRKVLDSLAKMPGNLPARQPALLGLIRAQIGALPGDNEEAHKVLSLLQAQGAVAEVGTTLTYPLLAAKAQVSIT